MVSEGIDTVTDWIEKLSGAYERIQTAKFNVRIAEAQASENSLGLPFNRGAAEQVVTTAANGVANAVPTLLLVAAGGLLVWLALK